ncbi:MAG: bifunctional 5,10-methylenetetrahydrofolate dehydrogenase/5,10-methenyltetrahydrofolate cyclohydrolase [Acidobacteriota bacterium]
MSARPIDGTQIGRQIREEVRREVQELARAGVKPGLAAVLVGNNPASKVYVRNKMKTCEDLGIHSEFVHLEESASTERLLETIDSLNHDLRIDGILVQLPLPRQIDEQAILLAIDPNKDVDGLHPINAGNLLLGRRALTPCTPSGVVEILKREQIPIAGRHVVIIGRSNLVGKPQALLLLRENATVTICHSRTVDLPQVARQGDLLIAAIGRAAMITSDYVKPGAVVIDVGINRVEGEALDRLLEFDPALRPAYERNRSESKNYLLTGDVHVSSVSRVASALTPVPGGVGPLTIAMLMKNTVLAARSRRQV